MGTKLVIDMCPRPCSFCGNECGQILEVVFGDTQNANLFNIDICLYGVREMK